MPSTAATGSKSESEGVALWLHEMAERSGISTEDHIKLRYAAELISASSDAAAAASAILAALEQMRAFVGVTHGEGPEANIPEMVPTRIGIPVKLGAIMRDVDAAIAAAKAAGIKAQS